MTESPEWHVSECFLLRDCRGPALRLLERLEKSGLPAKLQYKAALVLETRFVDLSKDEATRDVEVRLSYILSRDQLWVRLVGKTGLVEFIELRADRDGFY